LISTENIFNAWHIFKKSKRSKPDVQEFERHLEDNLFQLQYELQSKTYKHSDYQSFYIQDPKQRHIHKPNVRDRVVHQLLYDYLYKLHDKTFFYDSYSCRNNKGTHRAVKRLIQFVRKESHNYTRTCWSVKCDIRKFFAHIDHSILLTVLGRKIADKDVLWLIEQVIDSFHTGSSLGRGLPLGNLTSQIFANIYMNEFDQWIKHSLKIKYYMRYADDFILVSRKRAYLEHMIDPMKQYLSMNLALTMHPTRQYFVD